MKNRNPHKAAIFFAGPTVAIVAAVLLVISLVLFLIVVPAVVRLLIMRETRLVNGTETWEKWTDIKIPILIKFNIFNVTNVEDAELGGKFKLQEVGPFVWEEKRTKQIISVDEDKDTVSYREVVHYYFRRDLSVGDQEDTLNIINIPFISASTLIYKLLYPSLANYLIDFFVSMNEKFVLRGVKVQDLVFDGVQLGAIYENLADFGIVELPEEFIDGTFAFYNQKNGTPSKEFKVNRGVKNYKDFGKIVQYDHEKEVSWWTNSSLPANSEQFCNKINGSDGSLVAPFVTKDQKLRIFSPEICRSIYLSFDKEVKFQGIPAYRFAIPDELLQDPYSNADNKCFCTDPGSGLANSCRGNGAIRMFSCKKGVPIGLSLPHFLQGDQKYHDQVDGMLPDPSKHETDVIVEPNSGAILRIVKRIQIGTEFQRLPGINAFSHIFESVVPVFWAEERADLAEADIAEIRDRLVMPLEILKIWRPIILVMLTLSFISGVLMSLYEIYFIRPQRLQCISIL